MDLADQACFGIKMTTALWSVLLTVQLIMLAKLDAFEFADAGVISYQAVVTPGSGGDNNVQTKQCKNQEVCEWTHFCEQTFYYNNNTATVSCKPCYPVCKSPSSDDTCKSLCPAVWEKVHQEIIRRDSQVLKEAESQEKTVTIQQWNVKARFIAGVAAAIATVIIIFGIKKGCESLEVILGPKPRGDEEPIIGGSAVILSDQRIGIEGRDESIPVSATDNRETIGTSQIQRGVLLRPPVEDIHLKDDGDTCPNGSNS